jgi:hypothetical protein
MINEGMKKTIEESALGLASVDSDGKPCKGAILVKVNKVKVL